MRRCFWSSFRGLALIALMGVGATADRTVVADTNLVMEKSWVVDGTGDLATNASSITVTTNGQPAGAFSELAFSYNIDGTNMVLVGVVKGSGEIQMALPFGPFGGSFFLTGYWDCDAGYVPTMAISNLDIQVKGGKKAVVEMKGKISNGVSMAATDFELIMMTPRSELMEAKLSYTLTATTDFCVDEIIHTNQDNFQAVRMASNYLSPETNENDVARFGKVTGSICVLEYCGSTVQSFCCDLADQDSLLLTNRPPKLGGRSIWLVNDGTVTSDSPTLQVKFMTPPPSQMRPQGVETFTDDPTVENVSYWGNWSKAKGTYRSGKKVAKMRYMLEVIPPGKLSCDYAAD